PVSRAASGFEPTAYTQRPAVVNRSTHAATTASEPAAQAATTGYALCVSPNHWNAGGRSVTHAPPVDHLSDSRKLTTIASVTTIEGMRAYATNAPLVTPTAHPVAAAARKAAAADPVSRATRPATTEQTANSEPDEMSISPVSTTIVVPIATTRTGRLA